VKHPPYQLRPNKAVDRLTLIDLIRLVINPRELCKYTYYSLGGPTLEDFRLIYDFFPEIKMVCIESDEQTYRRQKFHIPCRSHRLKLRNERFSSFLAQYEARDERSIFWLDYTDLTFSQIEEFVELVGKVAPSSIVKVTLRSNPMDYKAEKSAEEFKKQFKTMLSDFSEPLPSRVEGFAVLVQKMLQIASQTALPSAMPLMFLPLSSFYYIDSVGIFTLTGIVCQRTDENSVRKTFKNWRFANLDWQQPQAINVPNLSTKERLHLQRYLPRAGDAGKALRRTLGYLIDETKEGTEAQLQQYANFYRYYPYFIKAAP
jgi:hypothetical protein